MIYRDVMFDWDESTNSVVWPCLECGEEMREHVKQQTIEECYTVDGEFGYDEFRSLVEDLWEEVGDNGMLCPCCRY